MDRRHCCLHTRLLVNYYFEFANGPGKLDRPMDKNLVVFCLAVQKTGGKGPHCDEIEEDSSGLVRSLKWHGHSDISFFTVGWTIWMKMIDKVSMVPQCGEICDITMTKNKSCEQVRDVCVI